MQIYVDKKCNCKLKINSLGCIVRDIKNFTTIFLDNNDNNFFQFLSSEVLYLV